MKSLERKAKDAANMRAWRAANRERSRAIDRASKARNVESIKATKKRCYEKHREQNLTYAAAYRAENGEQIRANLRISGKNSIYSGRYYAKNAEKCREAGQAWKDANRDRRKATNAAWAAKNYDKRRADSQNRRKRIGDGVLSVDIGPRLYALQKGRCACCAVELNGKYEFDHIMPLYLGGAHEDLNIQLLTQKCNRSKRAQHPVAYMQAKGSLL